MNWPLYLIAGALSAFWLLWRYKNRRMIEIAKKLPGPRALPFLGNALLFMEQPDEFIKVLNELKVEFGGLFKFWLGPDLNVVVSNPDDVKLLLTNAKTSAKGPQYKYLADVIGGGLLSGSGSGQVCCFFRTLMGLTKEQTLKIPHIEKVIDDTPSIHDIAFKRMTKWYLQIDSVFWVSSEYYALKNFMKIMTEFSEGVLLNRAESLKTLESSKRDLMNAEDDADVNTQLSVIDRFLLSQELNKEELVQETFTIFTTSQEPTAKILSFILLIMAYHPKCQEKLYTEIKSVIGDEDRNVTDDDFKRMPYLDMVFNEVLRLFPAGTVVQRTINEHITISTHTLPAGCSLVVPIYHLHRDPRFWSNPDRFDPEHFNSENVKKRNPNCYIPFSLGPMGCLGRYFAANLIKTLCTRVLREFELTSTETYDNLRVIIYVAVNSVNGFPIMLNPRKKIS